MLPAKTQVCIENPKCLNKLKPLCLRNIYLTQPPQGKSHKYIPTTQVLSFLILKPREITSLCVHSKDGTLDKRNYICVTATA